MSTLTPWARKTGYAPASSPGGLPPQQNRSDARWPPDWPADRPKQWQSPAHSSPMPLPMQQQMAGLLSQGWRAPPTPPGGVPSGPTMRQLPAGGLPSGPTMPPMPPGWMQPNGPPPQPGGALRRGLPGEGGPPPGMPTAPAFADMKAMFAAPPTSPQTAATAMHAAPPQAPMNGNAAMLGGRPELPPWLNFKG